MRKLKKTPYKSEYQLFVDELSENGRASLRRYFTELSRHVLLPENQKQAMLADFENAVLYYARNGVELSEALKRLDALRLGGFYARPPVLWYPLDDAAKIYPLSMKRNQMAVFRLSAYLTEDVVPELMQIALTFVITRFPSFATTVKNGFFWHYMDSAKRRFSVEPESGIPCRPLEVSASGSQSFRVVYYGKRVSVEFFHILTDGTGGMVFLKTLVAEYLRLLGENVPCADGVLEIGRAPSSDETANCFSRAEPTEKTSGFMDKPAVQMSGRLTNVKPCQVLHFELDSADLHAAAALNGATVTAFVLALMFAAGKYSTDELDGSFQIQVPVNMRKFYPSETVRNFALYGIIKLRLSEIGSVAEILPEITRQLAEKTSREAMNQMMNATSGLVKILRFIPLFIKRPVAKVVYGFLGDRTLSNTLSNLGVVRVPEEMARHIEKFDFVLGTNVVSRASCSMVTFNSTAVLSVAKLTADPSFEECLLRLFRENGLDPAVKGSELYGN